MPKDHITLDLLQDIEKQLFSLLSCHGFIDEETPDPEQLSTFEHKVARLLYQGKNVPYDHPEQIKELAQNGNEHAINAISKMQKLLTKWNLYHCTDPRFSAKLNDDEENKLLASMNFGKGPKGIAYGEKSWPPMMRKESLLYDYGFETRTTLIPVIAQLKYMQNNIQGIINLSNRKPTPDETDLVSIYTPNEMSQSLNLHRKTVTSSCAKAVSQRFNSETGKRGVGLEQEIKSVLFKMTSQKTGQDHLLAFHTDGTQHKIDPNAFFNTHTTFQYLRDQVKLSAPQFDSNLAVQYGLAAGRVNAFTLENKAMEMGVPLTQCYDTSLLENGKTGFTNIGSNTWGIEIPDIQSYILSSSCQVMTYNRPIDYHTIYTDFDLIHDLDHSQKEQRELEGTSLTNS